MQMQCDWDPTDERDFMDRLRPVAARVRNNCAQLARRAYHHRQQVDVDLNEYLVLSEYAAYLAFYDLVNGKIENWRSFQWTPANVDELVRRATPHMRRDLQEKGSDAREVHYRNRFRHDAASVEQYCWDSWRDRCVEERHEREQVTDALSGLLPELRAALTEQELSFLVWKHIEGLSQKEMGDRIGGTTGQAAMGLMRARRKAALALGERWHRLFRDAILAA